MESESRVHEFCEYCLGSIGGRCARHQKPSELFELAKEITKPPRAKDATSIVFEELKKDIYIALQFGPLNTFETRLGQLLDKYEKHVRHMLEITRGIDT